jgi:hypothetical protein
MPLTVLGVVLVLQFNINRIDHEQEHEHEHDYEGKRAETICDLR